jgi:hypothetical protein
VVYRNGKEEIMKLNRNPIAAGGKLNSIALAQKNDEQFMVVI